MKNKSTNLFYYHTMQSLFHCPSQLTSTRVFNTQVGFTSWMLYKLPHWHFSFIIKIVHIWKKIMSTIIVFHIFVHLCTFVFDHCHVVGVLRSSMVVIDWVLEMWKLVVIYLLNSSCTRWLHGEICGKENVHKSVFWTRSLLHIIDL